MINRSDKSSGAPLTGAFVRSVKEPGRYGDGRGSWGLSLFVYRMKSGRVTKTWHQRLIVEGRPRVVTLGRWPELTLARARAMAEDNAVARDRGELGPTPFEAHTFMDAANGEIRRRAPTWKNQHAMRREWEDTLLHKLGALKKVPISLLDTESLCRLLEPIWIASPVKGRKVLQRLTAVFDHAIDRGWIKENPAGQRLKRLMPPVDHATEHRKALHWKDLPAALAAIRGADEAPVLKHCTLWTVLTACRNANARKARWEQIDEQDRMLPSPI